MEITYTKIGDYYLPNIIASQSKVGENIGKYGRLRSNHLKQNKKAEYIFILICIYSLTNAQNYGVPQTHVYCFKKTSILTDQKLENSCRI